MATAQSTRVAPATSRPGLPTVLRRLLPVVLCAIGVAAVLQLVYDPWYLNYDARYVYLDGQRGFYGDWQSPVMTWIWKVIDPVAPGAASMFLLIATLYWLGILVLSRALARRSLAVAITLPVLALTPPLFAFVGMIWRDVLMAGCWLLAAQLQAHATFS